MSRLPAIPLPWLVVRVLDWLVGYDRAINFAWRRGWVREVNRCGDEGRIITFNRWPR